MHAWHDVTPGVGLPAEFTAVVEIPMGSSVGPLLQSSGMFGIDPTTGKRVEGLEAQLDKAMVNIEGLLKQAKAIIRSITVSQVDRNRSFGEMKK